MLRVSDPRVSVWDAILPEEATGLPEELSRIDALLEDERFIAPHRAHFAERVGRPSVPIETVPRMLSLKHRYHLGYETLCREVSTPSPGGGSAASPGTSRFPTPRPS